MVLSGDRPSLSRSSFSVFNTRVEYGDNSLASLSAFTFLSRRGSGLRAGGLRESRRGDRDLLSKFRGGVRDRDLSRRRCDGTYESDEGICNQRSERGSLLGDDLRDEKARLAPTGRRSLGSDRSRLRLARRREGT